MGELPAARATVAVGRLGSRSVEGRLLKARRLRGRARGSRTSTRRRRSDPRRGHGRDGRNGVHGGGHDHLRRRCRPRGMLEHLNIRGTRAQRQRLRRPVYLRQLGHTVDAHVLTHGTHGSVRSDVLRRNPDETSLLHRGDLARPEGRGDLALQVLEEVRGGLSCTTCERVGGSVAYFDTQHIQRSRAAAQYKNVHASLTWARSALCAAACLLTAPTASRAAPLSCAAG